MRNVQQAIQMVRDGSTVKEAGRLCKVPTTTLRSHLCRLGVQSKWQHARHFNFSQKEKIRELRKLGLSYLDISKKTQVNEESVRTWCADIVLTDKQIKKNLGVDFEKKNKAIALRKSGRYVGEIANELNCSKSSVCSWVADYIKETGQDIDKKARARKKREDAAKSGADQVSLKKVVAQRKKGYSAKEIAGKLGVSPYVIKIALEQHVFSHDERAEIEKKAVLRLRERRAAGEIKAAGGVREGSGRSKSGYYKGIGSVSVAC